MAGKDDDGWGFGMTMLGVIGGSGVYDIEGLENPTWTKVTSSFGAPSDEILRGRLFGVEMAFLPRHGRGHVFTPSTINYRANIDALKRVGVTDILALSACGSLREDLAPGTFVLVDQYVDRTFAREKSFFDTGCVAHVSMAHPACGCLSDKVAAAAADVTVPFVRGGTYLVMEGPQFSSLAESRLYRQWGMDVIGMTNMPEAKLAREAEIRYAPIAMVTDYDCWHPDHDHVDVASVIAVMHKNADNARALVKAIAKRGIDAPPTCAARCDRVLDTALITAPNARSPAMIDKLSAVAGRVLQS
jgi:5'-methylthioadenosine phosphorylase